jgi:hypothetical protein
MSSNKEKHAEEDLSMDPRRNGPWVFDALRPIGRRADAWNVCDGKRGWILVVWNKRRTHSHVGNNAHGPQVDRQLDRDASWQRFSR